MPECPACLKTSNRRSRYQCPKCGAYVFLYRMGRGRNKKTIWVEENPSCKDLVEYLKARIVDYRNVELKDFEFSDYKAQLIAASVLLRKLKGNMDLAHLLIDQFYPGRDKNGHYKRKPPGIARSPQTMRGIIWVKEDPNATFDLALSYARSALRNRKTDSLERVEMFT